MLGARAAPGAAGDAKGIVGRVHFSRHCPFPGPGAPAPRPPRWSLPAAAGTPLPLHSRERPSSPHDAGHSRGPLLSPDSVLHALASLASLLLFAASSLSSYRYSQVRKKRVCQSRPHNPFYSAQPVVQIVNTCTGAFTRACDWRRGPGLAADAGRALLRAPSPCPAPGVGFLTVDRAVAQCV